MAGSARSRNIRRDSDAIGVILADLNRRCLDLFELISPHRDLLLVMLDWGSPRWRRLTLAGPTRAEKLAAALVLSRYFDHLIHECWSLCRATRAAHWLVPDALEQFTEARTLPLAMERCPGETGARAIWNMAAKLTVIIQEDTRAAAHERRRESPIDPIVFLGAFLSDVLRYFDGWTERDFGALAAALRWERSRLRAGKHAAGEVIEDSWHREPKGEREEALPSYFFEKKFSIPVGALRAAAQEGRKNRLPGEKRGSRWFFKLADVRKRFPLSFDDVTRPKR